jgi:hypothetical protein
MDEKREARDRREARAARSQALYRDINERVKLINDGFGEILPLGDWLCECANDGCAERIALTIPEYESVRSNPRRFIVVPDASHFFSEIEDLVEERERYWVVEKRGLAAELAARVDPRTVGVPGMQTVVQGKRD